MDEDISSTTDHINIGQSRPIVSQTSAVEYCGNSNGVSSVVAREPVPNSTQSTCVPSPLFQDTNIINTFDADRVSESLISHQKQCELEEGQPSIFLSSKNIHAMKNHNQIFLGIDGLMVSNSRLGDSIIDPAHTYQVECQSSLSQQAIDQQLAVHAFQQQQASASQPIVCKNKLLEEQQKQILLNQNFDQNPATSQNFDIPGTLIDQNPNLIYDHGSSLEDGVASEALQAQAQLEQHQLKFDLIQDALNQQKINEKIVRSAQIAKALRDQQENLAMCNMQNKREPLNLIRNEQPSYIASQPQTSVIPSTSLAPQDSASFISEPIKQSRNNIINGLNTMNNNLIFVPPISINAQPGSQSRSLLSESLPIEASLYHKEIEMAPTGVCLDTSTLAPVINIDYGLPPVVDVPSSFQNPNLKNISVDNGSCNSGALLSIFSAPIAISNQSNAHSIEPRMPSFQEFTVFQNLVSILNKLAKTQVELQYSKQNLEIAQQTILNLNIINQNLLDNEKQAEEFKAHYNLLQELNLSKSKEIGSLNLQLKDTMKQLDKVNAYIAKKVVAQATQSEYENQMKLVDTFIPDLSESQASPTAFQTLPSLSPIPSTILTNPPISHSVPISLPIPILTTNPILSSHHSSPPLLDIRHMVALTQPPILLSNSPIDSMIQPLVSNLIGGHITQMNLDTTNLAHGHMITSLPQDSIPPFHNPFVSQQGLTQPMTIIDTGIHMFENIQNNQTMQYFPTVNQQEPIFTQTLTNFSQNAHFAEANNIHLGQMIFPQSSDTMPLIHALLPMQQDIKIEQLPNEHFASNYKKQKQFHDPLNLQEWLPAENVILAQKTGELHQNWEEISKKFQNKSPEECEAQWIIVKPRKGKWSKGEDARLVAAYQLVLDQERLVNNNEMPNTMQTLFWFKLSGYITGRSGQQCMARYNETLDPSVKSPLLIRKGKWAPEEDILLVAAYETHGKCWVKLSGSIPGRTQRQCRTRWVQINKDIHKEDEEKLRIESKEVEVTPSATSPLTKPVHNPFIDPYYDDDSDCYDEDPFP